MAISLQRAFALAPLVVAFGVVPQAGTAAPRAVASPPQAAVGQVTQSPQSRPATPEARVLIRRQPLGPGGYSASVRATLLALGTDVSVLDGLPLTTAQGVGAGGAGTLDLLTLTVPETGLNENYLFYQPPAPVAPTPLLVHFHAASVSAYDLVFFTTFLEEAETRNWFVVAPTQVVAPLPFTNSYSSVPSQYHVERVLEWVLANHTIDLDRIYGYGFSMGAGGALNYAARHLDRSRGTFAAVANHTGTLCLTDEYVNSLAPTTVQPTLEHHFGGPPVTHRFAYQRSSVLDLDDDSQLILGGEHLAVNLAHVPIQSWYATGDPQVHLVAQAQRLDELMSLVPGASHALHPRPGTTHRWDAMDEFQVCEFFAAHALTIPSGGELRVDHSGRFLRLELTIDQTDRFAHLFHDARPARFSLTRTTNLVEARVDALEAGLDPAQVPFEVLVDTADGAPDRVVVTSFTRGPGVVERDGVAVATGWSYDGGTQTLTIEDPDGATHLWAIR